MEGTNRGETGEQKPIKYPTKVWQHLPFTSESHGIFPQYGTIPSYPHAAPKATKYWNVDIVKFLTPDAKGRELGVCTLCCH